MVQQLMPFFLLKPISCIFLFNTLLNIENQ
jgi:hypothetical protein